MPILNANFGSIHNILQCSNAESNYGIGNCERQRLTVEHQNLAFITPTFSLNEIDPTNLQVNRNCPPLHISAAQYYLVLNNLVGYWAFNTAQLIKQFPVPCTKTKSDDVCHPLSFFLIRFNTSITLMNETDTSSHSDIKKLHQSTKVTLCLLISPNS